MMNRIFGRHDFDDSVKHRYNRLAHKIKEMYPNAIPIIFIAPKGVELDKNKFLAQETDVDFEKIMKSFYSQNNLQAEKSYSFSINDQMISPRAYLKDIFKRYEYNGILYIYVCPENTFG